MGKIDKSVKSYVNISGIRQKIKRDKKADFIAK